MGICAEYQIEEETQYSKALVLVPWVRCTEEVIQKTPPAREREDFVLLNRELKSLYLSVPPENRIIDSRQMNAAVSASFRSIRNPDATPAFTEEEKQAINHSLKTYALYLAETGRFAATPLNTVASKKSWFPKPVPPRKSPLTSKQKQYCAQYKVFLLKKSQKDGLAEYLEVLNRQEVKTAQKDKLEQRIRKLDTELMPIEKNLKLELKQIRKQSLEFFPEHCL